MPLRLSAALFLLTALRFAAPVYAAARNSVVMNLANTVSGDAFLDKGKEDPGLRARSSNPTGYGRYQGNGQNWFELLVVQGDDKGNGSFANTLDMRGWKLDWAYNKYDPVDYPTPYVQYGSGTITFSQDPLWAAVPVGSFVALTEWSEVWYRTTSDPNYNPLIDPAGAGGLERAGGINGVGTVRGEAYNPAIHELLDLHTNAAWNPNNTSSDAAGDWLVQVYAGERNPDQSYKYFSFSGNVYEDGTGTPGSGTPIPIGTEAADLFAVNNDNWQWTIKDSGGAVIQGPIGEQDTGIPGATKRISSPEIFRLEAFSNAPTPAPYLNAGIADYVDGSTSTFGSINRWSGGAFSQDLHALRNWLVAGDVTLDGKINGGDFLAWQRGIGTGNPSLTNGDLSGNGVVDGADLAVWAQRFGLATATATVAVVPEPTSAALATFAAVAVAISFTRRFPGA